MAARVLIGYATRFGSTRGIAEVMGEVLRRTGAEVEVRRARCVRTVVPYHAVILGAPIYFHQWLPEICALIRAHWAVLCRKRVAYFGVGLPMRGSEGAVRDQALSCLDSARHEVPEVSPVALEVFTGALDPRDHAWAMRTYLRLAGLDEGDFRDWEAIRGWTLGLGFHHPVAAEELLGATWPMGPLAPPLRPG